MVGTTSTSDKDEVASQTDEVASQTDEVAPDKGGVASSGRFQKLPERIRPEDMVAVQETEPPPDPTGGRDTETDFMLRNAGF